MTFEDFLTLLPEVPSADYPIANEASGWAQYVEAPNARFVAPPLRTATNGSPATSSLIILSAAGATGKSTLGKEIARRRRAPFINLAARRVGSDAAVGLVTKVFGHRLAGRAFRDLESSALFLVLDALDETRIGSGEANFDAFLDDLAALLRGTRAPAAVILARIDTAEWIEWYLTELGVSVSRFLIDYFDEDASREFVSRYVEQRAQETVRPLSAAASGSFTEARDNLLAGIRAAASTGDAPEGLIRSVIGYAPVLEAVGEYLLDEENARNYHRLLQALQRQGREWELLLQVAETLMVREQGKVSKEIQEKLKQSEAPGWNGWTSVYSPDEQFTRLLAHRFKVQQPVLPVDLPITLRPEYERAIDQAVTEHPFRGVVDGFHPVFGEYLYARLLTDGDDRSSDLGSKAREVLRGSNYLPTRALGRFMLAITERTGSASLRGRDIGFAYESLLADQERSGEVWVTVNWVSGSDPKPSYFAVRGRTLPFTLVGGEDGLWFWRRLTQASVSTASDVELGLEGSDFAIGPSVDLECHALNCPAAELLVFTGRDTEEEAVSLFASSFVERARAPIVRGKRFYVSAPVTPWPWLDYLVRDSRPLQFEGEVVQAYNRFAHILVWFRASGYQELARVDELVETAATGGTVLGRELLDFAVERGLLRRGRLYELIDNELSKYGINYVDLRTRVLRPSVADLLRDFLRWRSSK